MSEADVFWVGASAPRAEVTQVLAIHSFYERILGCSRCRRLIVVAEFPPRHLDPKSFVCGECLGVPVLKESA